MALDSMSESGLLQLEQYLNTSSYREYALNKPYIPKTNPVSAHSHRSNHQNQPSYVAFHQSLTNQKSPLILDRIAYKLRMKSDLNVNTLREPHIRRRRRHHQSNDTNPSITDTLSTNPPSVSTKRFTRQPTAVTMKTLLTDELNGIEGNAVRVGTIDDLIKQYRRAEFRLVRRPANYSDSASAYVSNNNLPNERMITKPLLERIIKQPQALTEYHFNAPTLPHTPSYRTREKINYVDLPSLTDQYRQRYNSLERPPIGMNPRDKRIREKSSMHIEKQVCVCNKLNIIDPFHSEQISQTQQISPRYIFPPARTSGYFTRKTTHDTHLTPLPIKKKHEIKKKQQIMRKEGSLDSFDQLQNDDDDNSQICTETIKSAVSLTDFEDDLHNPPNTIINLDDAK